MRAGVSTGAGAGGAGAAAAGAGGAAAGAVVTGAAGVDAGLGTGLGAAVVGAVVTRGRAVVVVVLGAVAAVDPPGRASKSCVVHMRPEPSITTATPTVLNRGSTRFS